MKTFRVYFDDLYTSNYATFFTETATEARKRGQEYRRLWHVEESIKQVIEVPTISVGDYAGCVKVSMMHKGKGLACRTFDQDEPVSRVYDFIKECRKLQDQYIMEGSE